MFQDVVDCRDRNNLSFFLQFFSYNHYIFGFIVSNILFTLYSGANFFATSYIFCISVISSSSSSAICSAVLFFFNFLHTISISFNSCPIYCPIFFPANSPSSYESSRMCAIVFASSYSILSISTTSDLCSSRNSFNTSFSIQ